ncbi:hypothetical protein BKE30_03320 [Alkanindiges hydrocarboniclasticus]|jgi:hypothetical protein|uniref:DUF6160 domain-containing protein n=1 Tax=Alkanindiges hydrocarboniclasticus TaxID=1907941 RepID=A0A1S8CW04_9GAMM|nr:DUF6160 family protein [Alkanindiges hydrocarboniclasticus]ONG41488.1 hypothetical protein BKE30_03320 [Alkanindiges hydrocarboniclasticus]
MIRNHYKTRQFALTALAASMLQFSSNTYAMQVLDDRDLRKVDGQDGINISTEYTQADIDQLYWEDKTGTAGNSEQTLRATANGVKIRDTDPADIYSLGTNIKIDAGSKNGGAGLDFQITSSPSTISIDDFNICDTANTSICGKSLGSMAIQTSSPLTLGLKTSNGLFSETAQAQLNLGLNNINIYLGQKQNINVNTQNQLILKNFNFNFTGKGHMFVSDIEGLKLQTNTGAAIATSTSTPSETLGYVDLARVNDPDKAILTNGSYEGTNAGLNLEFMTKANVDMSLGNPYSLDNAKGLIRVGASGRIVNGYLQVRGIDARDTTNNILGYAAAATAVSTTPSVIGTNASVMGSTGLAFRMKGDFTKENDSMLGADGKATTLEIGGAGLNTFGFEFGNLSPLVSGSTERAYFDSGNIYLNLANTKYLQMPENAVLRTSRFGGTTNTFLTSAEDYKQQIHNLSDNPYSLTMAIRGMDFQALSKRGRFTSSSGVSVGNAFSPSAGLNNKWGLGLPIYNLNANIATYGTTYNGDVYTLNNLTNEVTKSTVSNSQRLGFAMALSTQGRDSTGSKTTSILVIDGADNPNNSGKPTDYYFGLRNIDMLLSGYGTIGVENSNFNVTLPNLLIVMAAEVAAGYLPGAKAKTLGSSYFAPTNNFALNKDVLFGLKIKLLGDMNFALVPNNSIADGNRLSIIGDYKMIDGTVQISDPIDESMIGFDRMSGLIRFNNAIVISKDNSAPSDQQGNVSFNFGLTFNPNQIAGDVFRVKDINFYPPVNSVNNRGQRLGEMVITGGRLNANMTLVPRN